MSVVTLTLEPAPVLTKNIALSEKVSIGVKVLKSKQKNVNSGITVYNMCKFLPSGQAAFAVNIAKL